jgi:hypothetical protein
MLTHVEFRSDQFPPLEGEEALVNPQLWGRRLAEFLRHGLGCQGFELSQPTGEDWGYRLDVLRQPTRMWIGCGHYQVHDDSYLCFIEPHKPIIRKLLRSVDTRPHVGKLQQAIDTVLGREASVRDKRWWTYEEFNQPSSTAVIRAR